MPRSSQRATYSALATEALHPRARNLELLSTADLVALMLSEERRAQRAAYGARREITRATDLATSALSTGGRLIYVGAGTSGRLAVLDAAELVPTFGLMRGRVIGLLAGGNRAMVRSVEGAEDRAVHAARRLDKLGLSDKDIVCAIAASGVTPFARGALAHARARGCKTIFITCVADAAHRKLADVVITAVVGPEVIAGSTRLKAGTATKLILNALSTTMMIRLGKVYRGRMVDMLATNDKLRDRARRIVMELTGLDDRKTRALLRRAGNRAKLALAMHLLDASPSEAAAALASSNDDLRVLMTRRSGRFAKRKRPRP